MVRARPSQKSPLVRSLKTSQAASATHSGEVFPSSVALAAEVNFNEVFQVKWSRADASPARTGRTRIQPPRWTRLGSAPIPDRIAQEKRGQDQGGNAEAVKSKNRGRRIRPAHEKCSKTETEDGDPQGKVRQDFFGCRHRATLYHAAGANVFQQGQKHMEATGREASAD